MIIPAPATVTTAAHAPALELVFAQVFATTRAAADPAAVLSDRSAPLEARLAAIDALQSRIPTAAPARQKASVAALLAAAADAAQPPEVRAKALTQLGYALPRVDDETARATAFSALFAALDDPAYRLFVLRGLGSASHGLPEALEAACQAALLKVLAGPSAGEERQTALVALYAFVSAHEDLAKRKPGLAAELDASLLSPLEADPGAFVRDPRGTPDSRELQAAVIWASARLRQAAGDDAPATRVKAALDRLASAETDPGARAWFVYYRDAAPPARALRDKTTKRAPTGSDAP